MTIADWLISSMTLLHDAGVDSPRRDALVLLEDTLEKDRGWVTTHPEYIFQGRGLETVNKLVERRLKREPLAYIRGRAWFYGRFFEVNPDVMIPRPESETFIELTNELVDGGQLKADNNLQIVDVGTGSGCLAITAKLEFPKAEIIAIDVSNKALVLAQKNAESHKVQIKFEQGNLLQPIPNSKFQIPNSIVLANLPYVPKGLITSPEITQEPPEALFSGPDGLDHYRELFGQIAKNSQIIDIKYIMTESLENQHEGIIKLASSAGYKHVKTEVLVQLFQKT